MSDETDTETDTDEDFEMEEDSESDSDLPKVHPLLLEHVGQKIFSFFGWSYSSKELLACRLVCKSWCTMITNGIKRRNQPRQLTFGFGDTAQLRGFNLAMRGTRNLPLDRFEFTIHFFIRWHTDFFSDFLNISGPFLSSLTLTFGRQYSLDLLSINFHEFSFTSLKTLRFECSEVITMPGDVNSFLQLPHPGEQAKGILNLFRAILKSTMHLSCVELKVPCRYEIGDNSIDPIDGFGQTLCENIPESVVDLRLTCQLNDQHLQMLDSKLKLRTLRLNFYGSQFSADCLKKFLHQQASTLRELKLIDFEDVYSNWNEIFPAQFSKLKVLCVKDAEFYKLHPPNPFIQLEKLALLTAKPVWTTKTFFYQNFIFTTITEIDLRYTVENTKDIESIPYHFPHIRILRIHVMLSSNKCVEKVFEKLKCLKELQLTFTTLATRWIADPFLTGLTEEACQEIGANRLFESHEQFQILSRVPRRPCLENLPGLEKLVIDINTPEIIITDVSAYYSLFRTSSLRKLSILGHHCISPECIDLLKMRFNLCRETVKTLSSPPSYPAIIPSMALVPYLN